MNYNLDHMIDDNLQQNKNKSWLINKESFLWKVKKVMSKYTYSGRLLLSISCHIINKILPSVLNYNIMFVFATFWWRFIWIFQWKGRTHTGPVTLYKNNNNNTVL